MEKHPMSSAYILLIGYSQMCSSSVGRTRSGVRSGEVASDSAGLLCGLAERTTCQVCNMCPLRVSSASGQYLLAWAMKRSCQP